MADGGWRMRESPCLVSPFCSLMVEPKDNIPPTRGATIIITCLSFLRNSFTPLMLTPSPEGNYSVPVRDTSSTVPLIH